MRIGVASTNPSFMGPVLKELHLRGHELIQYQPTGDPQKDAYQIGQIRGLSEAIFVDFAQEPLLPIANDARVPVTVRMHRVEVYDPGNYVVNPPEGGTMPFPWRKVENLVFVAEHVRDRFVETCRQRSVALPRNMHVIPHVGVDTALFAYRERDWSARPLTLVCVGSVVPKKRQYTLLEMFADAEKRWPGQFALRFVGGGGLPGYGNPEYPVNIGDAITRLGLDHVTTTQGVPHEDMPGQFGECHLVVNASNEEGCATAVAEGMATGCIPLCAHWRGAEALYPKRWLWDTPGGFMDLLSQIAEADPKQLAKWSRAARKSVADRYEQGPIVKRLCDLIQTQTKPHFYDSMLPHFIEQANNPRQQMQGEWMLEHLTPYTRMLEIGCAIGRQCELAARAGIQRIVGADISRDCVFHAISSAQAQGLPIEYHLVTEGVPLPRGPFDLAVCFDTLEHMNPEEWGTVIEGIGTRVDKGGTVLISFPYRSQVQGDGFQIEEYRVYPKIIRAYLHRAGFTVAMAPFGPDEEEFRIKGVKE